MAKKLIRERPNAIAAALTIAIAFQNASKNFKIRRRADEPMEVDAIGQGTDRVARLEKHLEEVVTQVGALIKTVNNSPREAKGLQMSWRGRQGDQKQQWRTQNGPQDGQWRPSGKPQWRNDSRPSPSALPPLKWSPDGRPICSRRDRIGHIRRDCRMDIVFALVDSGADLSLMSIDSYGKLDPVNCLTISNGKEQSLVGVTGHPIKVVKFVKIKFAIGGRQLIHDFYVVKGTSRNMILGSDFFEAFEAKLDFSNKTLAIGKSIVLLRDKSVQHSVSCIVRCRKTTVIPARSVVHIHSGTSRRINGVSLMTPLDNCRLLKDQPGLLVPNTLYDGTLNLQVPIYNKTNNKYTVKQGEIIGLIENLTHREIGLIEKPTQREINDINTETPIEGKVSANVTDRCQDNKQMEEDITKKLSHIPSTKQKGELKSLLKGQSDLFAKNDLELGKTNLVNIKIDT